MYKMYIFFNTSSIYYYFFFNLIFCENKWLARLRVLTSDLTQLPWIFGIPRNEDHWYYDF